MENGLINDSNNFKKNQENIKKRLEENNRMNKDTAKLIIQSYLEYPDGWDNYGAKQYDKNYINMVVGIVSNLNLLPHNISPTGDSTVLIEYMIGDGYLGMELLNNDKTSVCIIYDSVIEELEIPTSILAINNEITNFYERY